MDTYKAFDHKTKEEVEQLLKEYGRPDNLNDSQNDSPTMGDMLELADEYPTIKYMGYIITKPRDDWRVSLEGFTADDLSADEVIEMLLRFKYADEADAFKDEHGRYKVRFWWD